MTQARVLHALARRQPTHIAVALVAAHPDDETIGAGASMPLLRRLLLVHVTDGAPANLRDARAAGFDTAAAYAAQRSAELSRALQAGGVRCERVGLNFPDQQATAHLPGIVAKLSALFAHHGIQVVLTHPYEGGHPDHDAAACAAQRTGLPRIEMTSYHRRADGLVSGCFLPNGGGSVRVALTPAEQARKRAMLDCFTSQRATLAPFGAAHEAFRPAPVYDFRAPPHPGRLHYEAHDWGMTGPSWRALAGACAG